MSNAFACPAFLVSGWAGMPSGADFVAPIGLVGASVFTAAAAAAVTFTDF